MYLGAYGMHSQSMCPLTESILYYSNIFNANMTHRNITFTLKT